MSDQSIKKRYNTKSYRLNYFSGVFFSFGILFFFLLQVLYTSIIVPNYGYAGFDNDYKFVRGVNAWALYIIALLFMWRGCKKNSLAWEIFEIIIMIAFAPSLVMYMYKDTPFIDMYVVYFFVMLASMGIIPQFRIHLKGNYRNTVIRLFGILTGITLIFIWARYTHFHIQISLLDVYGQRAEAAGYAMPRILSYIYAMTKSVIPLMVVYYMDKGWKKNLWKILYYVFLQYISFCIDGSKGTVFLVLLSIVAYIVSRKMKNYEKWIPLAFALAVFAGIMEEVVRGTYYLVGVFFRRVMFVPANLNYDYYNYFSEREFDYFRSSIFRFFEKSPYLKEGGIPIAIGNFNGSGSSANNGLFSDAYTNLGVAGVIIMPILIVLVFKLIEGAAKGLDNRVVVPVVIMTSMVLVSSALFTSLLSHGILLCIILLYFLPRKKSVDCRANQRCCTQEVCDG